MGVAVAITRFEHSVAELRGLAARSVEGAVACRLLAIAHVLDGASRAEAAASCGMDRQNAARLGDRFDAEGLAGLTNRTSPGRSPALSDARMAELKGLVLAGPDLATYGVVRWRCSDVREVIGGRFGVQVHERTVGKLLGRVRLTRLQPRPHNPKRDEAAQEVFKKLSRPRSGRPAGRGRREAAGDLVRGRGPGRSAGHIWCAVGRDRLTPRRRAR